MWIRWDTFRRPQGGLVQQCINVMLGEALKMKEIDFNKNVCVLKVKRLETRTTLIRDRSLQSIKENQDD